MDSFLKLSLYELDLSTLFETMSFWAFKGFFGRLNLNLSVASQIFVIFKRKNYVKILGIMSLSNFLCMRKEVEASNDIPESSCVGAYIMVKK